MCVNQSQTKFMKLNAINLLTKLVGILGVTSVIASFAMVASASEAINPNPSIFQERKTLAQGRPRPSIFDECPYNRAACGNTTPSVTTPAPTPTPVPDTTVPTTPTIPTPPATSTEGKDLVSIAQSNPSFSTLTKALKAAGLIETLQGEGPFTIFAPTDEAFAELPQDALQDLLKPENKEVLVKILTYHVVPGNVESSQLKAGEVKTVQGDAINVKISSDKKAVTVNDAEVVTPDVKGYNGVIHIINKVIIPPSL